MVDKKIYIGGLLFSAGIFFGNPAFAGMECDGTHYNGVFYKRGQHYYPTRNGVLYDCIACGNCTPKRSGSAPFVSSGKLRPSQQMSIHMMQGMLQPLFEAMFQDTFSPPDAAGQEELARQQEEARKKQEEMKKKALDAWQKAQKEMEAEAARQEAQRREAGQQILAQNRIGEEIKLEPSLFGTYQAKLEARSISSGYPAPKRDGDKARCAAYFSKKAQSTKEIEGAQFFSRQAEKVMQGLPTDYPCQFEKTPEVPEPQESYAKNEEVEAFLHDYQTKLNDFEEIQTRVNEARKQKLEAEHRLKEADAKLEELRTQSAAVDTAEQKGQVDDLLSQAMAAKEEAENDLNTAKENERKLLDTARQKADEIKSINEQISALKNEDR